jgi:predicted esterase
LTVVFAAITFTGALAVQDAPPPGFTQKARAILDTVETGEVTENITSAFDPTQSYAVYLPSGYKLSRKWPVIFLMDPRGRARRPIDRFIEVAEQRGYVLVSSYNTASDTAEDVNTPALRAMLTDTSYLFSLDSNRFYLSGFSGTARVAWIMAAHLKDNVAGIIAFGGGLPGDYRPPAKAPYTYYGAAGRTDFNYEEMRALDRELDDHEIVHRFESFDGSHQWGPSEVCTRAVEWMELQAVKSGLRAGNDGIVDDVYRRRLSETESLDDPYVAYLQYRALVEDFRDLVASSDIEMLASKVSELRKRDEVKDALELEDDLAEDRSEYMRRFSRFIHRFEEETDRLWTLRDISRELRLADLEKQSKNMSEPRKAYAAQRILEQVFVNTSFYLPREYLEEEEPARAILMLSVAEKIHPGRFGNLIFFARAYAQKGDEKKAFEALQQANQIHPLTREFLANDSYFDPIREEPVFQEFFQSLK